MVPLLTCSAKISSNLTNGKKRFCVFHVCLFFLTPLVHRMPFSTSGDSDSSIKVIRFSLLRIGGVIERPGEAEGVATGVGLRLLRRMDWGVKAEKTGPEAAKARAR